MGIVKKWQKPQIDVGLLDYRKGCGPESCQGQSHMWCKASLTGTGTQPKSAPKQT